MLIDQYRVELHDPECVPEARGAVYAAKVLFPNDVSEVMPYLNRTLERADYSGNYDYIIWKDPDRRYALRPHELAVSNVTDRGEAGEVAARTVAMINDVWEKREGIEPDHERMARPRALDLFKLLPRTNCGECGMPSCMAFAVDLAAGDAAPCDCPPLAETENAEALRTLESLCG